MAAYVGYTYEAYAGESVFRTSYTIGLYEVISQLSKIKLAKTFRPHVHHLPIFFSSSYLGTLEPFSACVTGTRIRQS